MSSYAANIARWNAIPMARESPMNTAGTKRSRSRSRSRSASPVLKLQGEYDSSDEDNISLVSRSPSPSAEKMDITTYDEHHPAPEKEVITVETKIKSTNKGYSLLAKLGWTAGQPLGLSGDGRVDPIPFSVKNDVTGLGKRAQDERMIETTVSQRRGLDSERQIKETIEQRQSREQKVAEQEALKHQIASTLKPFYCALCDKQYQTVAQYDEHTNSYAHHHKQRFKDMQVNAKGLGGKQDKEARLAKERKREEKEFKRMAKAQGVKVTSGAIGGVGTPNVLAPAAQQVEEQKGFKKSGWATVSTPIAPVQAEIGDNGSSKKSGWATVSGNGLSAQSPAETSTARVASASTPGFRTAGFETLETTSVPQPVKSGGWSTVVSESGVAAAEPLPQSRSRWSSASTAVPLLRAHTAASRAPSGASPPPPPATPPPPTFAAPPPPPPSWAPRPPSPPRYPNIRPPSPPRGPPSRYDGRSSSPYRTPGRYTPGDRPPSPRFASLRRSPSPPPPPRDRYDERDQRDWQDHSRYQGNQGYRR